MDEGVRPTDDEREIATVEDGGDDGGSVGAERGRGELAGEMIELAEEMMRDAAAEREREFVGGEIEAAVELHFVRIDDFGREAGGEVDGEGGFAGAGGAEEKEEFVGRGRGEDAGERRAAGMRGGEKVRERKGKCHRNFSTLQLWLLASATIPYATVIHRERKRRKIKTERNEKNEGGGAEE